VGDLDDEFTFVAASVERAAKLQRSACAALLEDDAAAGRALAAHIDLAYDAVEHRLAERRAAYQAAPDDAVRVDAIVEMRRLVWDVRRLQSNLGWLEAAQDSPLDLGTRYFVEDAARALVASDVEVTVVAWASDQSSYATTSDPWEPLIKSWGKGWPPAPTVVVVLLPRREQRSGLLHPLIVHELGHAADSEHGIVDGLWQIAHQRKRLTSRFAKAVSELAQDSGVDIAEANATVSKALRAWITEAFCDSVAVHHLGPTYLYSFVAEVIAGTLDEPGPSHPPARQRIRRLLAELDRLGWTQVMRDADPALEAWLRALASAGSQYLGLPGFLGWAVDEMATAIRTNTHKRLKGRVFEPRAEELAEVATLLGAKIPPAQRHAGDAIPRESIILECWHAALSNAGGGPAALAVAPDAAELKELLPAALELSAVSAAWSEG
jgi:hypothetical protein